MRKAIVGKDRTGYWAAWCKETGKMIGGYQDSEIDAYRVANSNGYLVA